MKDACAEVYRALIMHYACTFDHHLIIGALQEFQPEPGRYDCVWIQWALLYLTDEDAIALFHRCAQNLKPGGIICVKENICKSDRSRIFN